MSKSGSSDPLAEDAKAKSATTENQPQAKNTHFKRGYIACVRCRSRKVKCVLESEPPCAKCRREHRQCVFKTERKTMRHREPPQWASDQQKADVSKSNPSTSLVAEDDSHAPPSTQAELGSEAIKSTSAPRPSLMERAMINIVPQRDNMLETLFDGSPLDQRSEQTATPDRTASECTGGQEPCPSYQKAESDIGQAGQAGVSQPCHGMVTRLSNVDKETLQVWNKYSLVRQRWFTAQEAVTYLDLFFTYLSPLSPVLVSEYKNHSNHRTLILEEPMLCSTMLMISSRFFVLPGAGGLVRSHFIHSRLWRRCARLLEQITFGKGTYSSTRCSVLGIIESCLLISDWHPRSTHFPAQQDELEEDLYLNEQGFDDVPDSAHLEEHVLRWSADVLEPSKRSDHMSWMLLGTATTLAYKIGVFSEDETLSSSMTKEKSRCIRTRKLLNVYVTNISVRLGCPSILPQASTFYSPDPLITTFNDPIHQEWDFFMKVWLELVQLIKTASAMFFESTQHTRRQLMNGQYVLFLQHFAPSLDRWRENFEAGSKNLPRTLKDLLLIEYHNLRIYTHALSMQAVVERALRQGTHKFEQSQIDVNATCFTNADYGFLQEVIAGSSEILKITINMALAGNLRYMPVRQSLCIISAAVFLLKGLSIGSSHIEVQGPLETLDQCMAALKSSPIDDMDFSSRFASLIDRRIAAFRASVLPPRETVNDTCNHNPSGGGSANNSVPSPSQTSRLDINRADSNDESMETDMSTLSPLAMDYLDQSFDPSVAPFSSHGNYISSLELDSLDFLWNLPEL